MLYLLSPQQAHDFAQTWLPAWTGNQPEVLAHFYSEDAFYLDPGVPGGIKGKGALLDYFRKLLARNPHWTWLQLESIPLQNGFLNKWLARIPIGDDIVSVIGVCMVQLDAEGKIYRNEVYFDRSILFAQKEIAG